MKARIGYEIFPDRFYSRTHKPKTLGWKEPITCRSDGSHQYDFYGGDLKGIIKKLDYIVSLDVDFVYLTPIFRALSSHRYDTLGFFEIDPMLGTLEDFKELSQRLHEENLRLVIDGVFNHISDRHIWNGDEKDFILKNGEQKNYWNDLPWMPELNLENSELRKLLWSGEDSVVKYWLRMGADDWRLDCAYDIGYEYCREISNAAKSLGDHETIGEIWSYPEKWLKSGGLSSVMNYYFRELITQFLQRELKGEQFNSLIAKTVADCGLEPILKCWNTLSTHDTPRLRHTFKDRWSLALCLQFTLPGSPLIYYGEELGLNTDGDPHCRQPFPWHLATAENPDLRLYRKWISLFKSSAALNSGDFEGLQCANSQLLSYARKSERIQDLKVIIINPTDSVQSFRVYTRESSLMNNAIMSDHFSDRKAKITNSTVSGEIPANSFSVLYPEVAFKSYSPYKRVLD
jgi:glycosidase